MTAGETAILIYSFAVALLPSIQGVYAVNSCFTYTSGIGKYASRSLFNTNLMGLYYLNRY